MTIETRKTKLKQFVHDYFVQYNDKSDITISALDGDAGLRNYYRIKINNDSYILMDCPPSYTSVKPFMDISFFLRRQGLHSPKVVHHDIENGFLILEDFGSQSMRKHISNIITFDTKKDLKDNYRLMIDVLVDIQKVDSLPSYLPLMDNDLLCSELDVFLEYYPRYQMEKGADNQLLTNQDKQEFKTLFREALELIQGPLIEESFVFRDYHVENIMYIPGETGFNKLGLLDFQDALIGSPIYDLVSLLEDARIDVERDFALECIEYYAEKKRMDLKSVMNSYHTLGAQRNLRILGVFTRKYLRDQDNSYLQYIPRVLKYISYDLSHPDLKQIKDWLLKMKLIH